MTRASFTTATRRAGKGRSARRAGGAWLLALAATGVALGCNTDRLLDVTAPSQVPVTLFDNPANAVLMVNSAIGDFECAYGSAVTVEGIISDELADSQLGAAAWPYDRRDANTQTNGSYGTNSCSNNQTPGIYTPLSTARWDADNALTKLQKWTDAQVPNRQTLIAKAALYAGFGYAIIGMSFCEAAFDLGPQQKQPAIFALAEQRFGTAITAAQAAGLTDVLNAAYVGRARVRLFQGNTAGAATDAALVPAGFVFNATMGSNDNRRYNRVFAAVQQFGFYTVQTDSRGLKTEGVEDSRSKVVAVPTTRPADAKSAIFAAVKYPSYASPIPIAKYEEAQLILAEARGGAQAVTIINSLRAAAGLPSYTGPTDAASIRTLIIEERRRALFLEGFRNYDIQRFSLPQTPAPGTPFPLKGGTYGNTTCLPLPDVERFNNPNITP
ncbi:MAG: RagB/SusD family nutrient uptake outer membrane protein [Gemmatimonadota bacterium]|nr:RagB/SusD family nutrient uptake outer membrane protein [Gemmatimonadota bacterium]